MNKYSFSASSFFRSCRRCLNPWIAVCVIAVIVGLFIFVPVVGAIGLIATLPLLGCGLMCGVMAFMMRGHKKDKH